MNIGIDPVVAWDKLSNFETAEEIRQYFMSECIKGLVRRANLCAIAEWLKVTTGNNYVCVASSIDIGLKENEESMEPEYVFSHTPATTDFIERFDNGDYPELEKKIY